jgi:hypothetical protein
LIFCKGALTAPFLFAVMGEKTFHPEKILRQP